MQDMDLQWQAGQLAENLQSMYPQMGWQQSHEMQGVGPDGLRSGDAGDAGPRRSRPAREPDAGRHEPGCARRGRLDRVRDLMGDDAAEVARAARRAGQDARGGRPDREQGRPARADPEGAAQDRLQRPEGSVLQADQGQDGPAPARPVRHRPRAHVRVQALRVRRPVPARSAPHDPQRACAGRGRAPRSS